MSMSRARAPTIRLVQGLGVGPPGMCLDSSWELLFMVVITIRFAILMIRVLSGQAVCKAQLPGAWTIAAARFFRNR